MLSDSGKSHPAQAARLAAFGVSQCVDVHCHCLPGVDDGPANMDEALELCHALVADGVTTVVATPHQLGRFDGRNSNEAVGWAVRQLQEQLDLERIPLHVLPGGDVRIDERLVELVRDRQVTTVADAGKYILLELPSEVQLDPKPMLERLRKVRCVPVITHPERQQFLQQRPQTVLGWLELGALLQVTAGSLLGDFGPLAKRVAWRWIQDGWVSIIATDAHGGRRPPRMTAAIGAIERNCGFRSAKELCIENPMRLVKGQWVTLPAASHVSCVAPSGPRANAPV